MTDQNAINRGAATYAARHPAKPTTTETGHQPTPAASSARDYRKSYLQNEKTTRENK